MTMRISTVSLFDPAIGNSARCIESASPPFQVICSKDEN